MKAILFHQHGGPEVLEYTEFPDPEPKAGEVLIRLRAAPLNRMDVMVRNGWPGLKLELPHINGAGGGVNSACIQVAKYLGSHVIVIGSSAKKLWEAQAIGPDILIDRSKKG